MSLNQRFGGQRILFIVWTGIGGERLECCISSLCTCPTERCWIVPDAQFDEVSKALERNPDKVILVGFPLRGDLPDERSVEFFDAVTMLLPHRPNPPVEHVAAEEFWTDDNPHPMKHSQAAASASN